jgi:competence transcription factor ComK
MLIDNYKFTKLSDDDAQLLTIKDINLETVNQCSYNIRNINKYSMEEFKIRLSYEFWDSIFSNNDNMDVDLSFNIFLNNYSRIVYTSFPIRKIIEELW